MSGAMPVLPWNKVPADVRENYVLSGYRPVSMGMLPCLRSAFLIHNETVNIWSHLLPLFYFMYFLWLDAEMWMQMDLPIGERFPLYGYILAICVLFATSSCAHWLNCVSWNWRHVFFMMDYGAISVYGVATAVAYYFYSYKKTPMISAGTDYFLPCTVGTAMFATWMCCWTRVNYKRIPNVCHVIRTLAFALPFIIGSTPAIARLIAPFLAPLSSSSSSSASTLQQADNSSDTSSGSKSHDAAAASLGNDDVFQHHYMRHVVLLIIGAFIHMAKVPERWFPGYFDIIGHSHQWFHLFVFLSIREQFWMVVKDITDSRQKGIFSASTTMSPITIYVVLVSTVLATIAWFSQYKQIEEHDGHCCGADGGTRISGGNTQRKQHVQ